MQVLKESTYSFGLNSAASFLNFRNDLIGCQTRIPLLVAEALRIENNIKLAKASTEKALKIYTDYHNAVTESITLILKIIFAFERIHDDIKRCPEMQVASTAFDQDLDLLMKDLESLVPQYSRFAQNAMQSLEDYKQTKEWQESLIKTHQEILQQIDLTRQFINGE